MEFPKDHHTFNLDVQTMVGRALLVAPVTAAGQTMVDVYLPSSSKWYRYETLQEVTVEGHTQQQVALDQLPVWIRGGNIIMRQDRVRRSSTQMQKDPFTVVVALDKRGVADGALYWDDGETFNYRKVPHSFALRKLHYMDGQLSNSIVMGTLWDGLVNTVERILVTGMSSPPKSVKHSNQPLEWTFEAGILIVERLKLPMSDTWIVDIET